MRNKWVRGIVAILPVFFVAYVAYIFPAYAKAIWSLAIAVVAANVLGPAIFDFIQKGGRPIVQKEPEDDQDAQYEREETTKVTEVTQETLNPDLVINLKGLNLYR